MENTTNATNDSVIDAAIKRKEIPYDLGEVFKEIVKNYPEGMPFNPQEVINTFNKIKNETIDPYYRGLVNLARDEFTSGYQALQEERAVAKETEEAQASENIRQAKENLEARGMTFSGEAVKALGAESAYPFAGVQTEGSIPQANRLMAKSSSSKYQQQLKSLGRGGETILGTEATAGLGLPTVGGVEGNIETQKSQDYGQSLRDILQNRGYLSSAFKNKQY
jgi:hypothetical protein